ncbi:MBL fold metallo-hydrolase [Aliterella atlantica]|uniref:hypothetical protein n=1 Tax=Aliterella atlantica TaxID=1827278 RepID=UPI0006962FC7|nr:hypothetical protein [Aliterella atlantica]
MINHCWRSHLISITICAGGIHEFDEIAIHPVEAEALRQGDAYAVLYAPEYIGALDEHFAELPYPGFTVTQYTFNAVEPTILLQEDDILYLGYRPFAVLHLPGHSHNF